MLNFICKAFNQLSLEEMHEVFMLRSEVFVVEQDCIYQDLDGKDPKALHILGVDQTNKIVAYSRILPKGEYYHSYVVIGRVVVSETFRGKKYGHLLVKHSIEQAIKHHKETSIKISAQSYLIPFYKCHGFVVKGDEYQEDGISHTAMILTI